MYVWRQYDCQVLAEALQAVLTNDVKIVVYHGGLDAAARQSSVAFVLRRSPLVCVFIYLTSMPFIHCCLPSSLEQYLQQKGRAGWDIRTPARALLLPLDDKVTVKHLLVCTNVLCRLQIRVLLQFLQNKVLPLPPSPHQWYYLVVPIEPLQKAMDCSKVETVETLLALLEGCGSSSLRYEGKNPDVMTLRRTQPWSTLHDEPMATCWNINFVRLALSVENLCFYL